MSAHADKVNAAIDAVKGRSMPATAQMIAFAAIAWGLGAAAYGLFAFDKGWTMGSILAGLVYAFGITQGSLVFAGVMTGTGARWSRPLKRVAESLGVAVVPIYLGIVLFVLVGTDLYPWSPTTYNPSGPISLAPHAPGTPHSKELWLDAPFFIARTILGLGFLVFLDLVYLRASLRPDLMLAKKRLGASAPAWWDRVIGGETDYEGVLAASTRRMENMIPLMAMSYALIFSIVIAFDLVMSLDPWWYSNMFGGWMFMSSFWLGLATVAATTMLSRDWLGLGDWVRPSTTHDLGKLMLAGCMFWAYTLYAQILPIWYTNVPEETNYLLVRMMLDTWAPMARAVAVLCFLAPFTILLSRGIKKMRWPFFGVASLIMFGLYVERSLLVLPSVYHGDIFPMAQFVIINLGILAGMLGLIATVAGRFLASVPAVPVSDTMLLDHPWDVHVHSLDHAHGHH